MMPVVGSRSASCTVCQRLLLPNGSVMLPDWSTSKRTVGTTLSKVTLTSGQAVPVDCVPPGPPPPEPSVPQRPFGEHVPTKPQSASMVQSAVHLPSALQYRPE